MSSGDAARAVLECVLCFAADATVVKRVFAAACELVTRVPVNTLVFRRDQGAWDLIS